MRRRFFATAFFLSVLAVQARAGVNVGISVGVPLPPPPAIVIEAPPRFIFSPALNFYVSVGVPYDIVRIGPSFYLYNNGYWYRSSYYDGPWIGVEHNRLPPGLRRHRFEEIRRFRDAEYHRYDRDREHYRGRWYSPREGHGGRGHGEHGGRDHGEREHGRHGHGDGHR